MKKLILFGMLFMILLVPIASAEIEYTPSSKTECYDSGRCYTTRYGGTMFAQDPFGEWTDASNVLSISKFQDDITFSYDGIKGLYSITFEAGVHYNGKYYSFTDVKALKPLIEFDFPVKDFGSHKKYDIIISGLDELDINKIENITLTYKSHFGFTLDQLKNKNRRFNIKDFVSLSFDDLFKTYPVDIKMDERRLYIANITDNIIDGVLVLDPNLLLDAGSSELIDDTMVIQKNPNTNYGGFGTMNIELEATTEIAHSYLKYNITDIPAGQDILWANLSMYFETNSGTNYNASAWELHNYTWEENEPTWVKRVTGAGGYINNAHNDNTAYTTWFPLNVTEWVSTEYKAGETFVSFIINGTFNGLGAGGLTWYTKDQANPARVPWLNITYQLAPDIVPGVHINVYSATTNATITLWSVTFNNGSMIYTANNNNNPTEINISLLPTGTDVNVTFFKAGWLNNTYSVDIDDSHTENMTAFLTPVINLSNCTSSDPNVVLIFRLRSEEFPSYFVNGTLDATFTTWLNDSTSTVNYNFSLGIDNTFHICITENEVLNSDAIIEYTDDVGNMSIRQYYLVNTILRNTTANTIDLYMLNESLSSFIEINVQTLEGLVLKDVIIKAQRLYIGEDAFLTVVMGKTNFDGQDSIYLRANDIFYRFILEQYGEVLIVIDPFKITETELTLTTGIGGLGEWFSFIDNFYWLCDTSDVTNVTSCAYSETSGKFVNACLRVREKNIVNNTVICESCSTSSSATVFCNLGANVEGRSFFYEFIGHFSETDYLFESGWLEFNPESVWGLVGILVTLMMIILAALLGSYNPSIAVAIISLSLIVSYVAGFMDIGVGSVIGIIVVGIIIVYKMRFS